MKHWGVIVGIIVFLGAIYFVQSVSAEEQTIAICNRDKQAFCFQKRLEDQSNVLGNVNIPKIATPEWISIPANTPVTRTVTYRVATIGIINADLAEFKQTASTTLNSPSGWSRLGVNFVEVEAGGDFVLWLAQDIEVPSFSPSGCDSTYSCSVGNNVILNQTRWLNGSEPWNVAGGNLSDYRKMVINHETGHWLGHGHRYCEGVGQAAPVMQQQSIDMQGCTPNPWPQSYELMSSRLGIRS
ncbi:DUF3152 domain-containing protein [Candidatus Saccharibacteria bacterium]|nr:DUF3152 domain-containing protein [Candidatus Saccharibacteria bacterium]NCU41095.1 DUF3152 domain-containing protein [Candidatus Saccharibacteria bacterium]